VATILSARAASQIATRRLVQRYSYAVIAACLFAVLLVVEIFIRPSAFRLDSLTTTIGLSTPLVMAAMAMTPAVLVGGGGIDLSVGPLMSLVGAVALVVCVGDFGISSPAVVVPVALGTGIASGLLVGILVAIVRLQPIVATLGVYLTYIGLTLVIAPQPMGQAPGWLTAMAGSGAVPLLVVTFFLWRVFTRTPLYAELMATGGDDRAAYAAGVPVARIRIMAYMLSGLLASVAGLALAAVIESADPNAGSSFTLLAIASVALGGVSLAGGRGGMLGAILGALNLFLMQEILTSFSQSSYVLELVYGGVLVLAVIGNSFADRLGGEKGSSIRALPR
jgi:ribose transport system permease protein